MSIDVKELRVGSWVMHEYFDFDMAVSHRMQININHFKNDDWRDIQPIPITEEVLLKCGFEKFHKFDMSDGNWRIKTKTHDFIVTYLHKHYIATIYFQVPVPYLHTLQNLFYAISGEELNYQP